MASNNITLTVGGALELILRPPPPVGSTHIKITHEGFVVEAEGDHMSVTLPVDYLIVVQVGYVDSHGNPAKVDGDVVWDTSDDEIARITPDQRDSTMCTITAVGKTGLAQVSATADADLGEGTRELITMLDVSVVAGEAVAGTINILHEPQPVGPHAEPRP